jgi:hypothetical protein
MVCKPQASFSNPTISAEMPVSEEGIKNLVQHQEQQQPIERLQTSSFLDWEDQVQSIFRLQSDTLVEESRDSTDETEEEHNDPRLVDWNSSWTLKRATPILDDDEEDEEFLVYESPSKKTKIDNLYWESRLFSEEDEGSSFDLATILRTR